MNALVVYETMFGNTRQIAEAIARGIVGGVTISDVIDAPRHVPRNVDLIVAGGPTHAFSMSRESTRGDAVVRGADAAHVAFGLREWIAGLGDGPHPQTFAAFDTRVDKPLLPGAASKAAARAARKMGFTRVLHESFRVGGYEGPVLDGELDRAQAWGASLAV